jgi:hypothetical protein
MDTVGYYACNHRAVISAEREAEIAALAIDTARVVVEQRISEASPPTVRVTVVTRGGEEKVRVLNGMEIAVLGLATHLDEPPELAMFAKVLAASATAKTFTISMYCIETHPCQHVVTFADEDGGQRKERLNGREIVALYQIWGKAPVSHFDVYRLAPK